MRRQAAASALVLLLSGVLAGCLGEAPTVPTVAQDAPAATGTLRGVVVDDAIRPLANATVGVGLPDGTALNTTTAADGTFAFTGLAPGAYLVIAGRPGYFDAQVTVTVLSDAETPEVRLVLPVDAVLRAAVDTFVFTGFLQCSVAVFVARAAACNPNEALSPLCQVPGAPCGSGPTNLTQDQFLALHTLSGANVAFLQSEMVWEDTGNGLAKNLRAISGARAPDDGKLYDFQPFEGPTPLIMPMPGNLAKALLLGNGRDYVIRVFASGVEGTAPPCLPAPVNCPWGVGAAVNQRFEVFTHVFYNWSPPEGWQFGRDGLPELPQP